MISYSLAPGDEDYFLGQIWEVCTRVEGGPGRFGEEAAHVGYVGDESGWDMFKGSRRAIYWPWNAVASQLRSA